jgi:hypothetical protein
MALNPKIWYPIAVLLSVGNLAGVWYVLTAACHQAFGSADTRRVLPDPAGYFCALRVRP